MIAALDRIPDGIHPIVGYRMWSYVLTRRGSRLHSLTCTGINSCPWEGAVRGWIMASCTRNRTHAAPDEHCTCGVYAVTTIPEMFQHGVPFERGDGVGTLMGRVELAGKIIKHENGYRAERARIAELIPIEGTIRDVMRFANRWGIPISLAVPLASRMSQPEVKVLQMIASGSTTGEVAKALGISRHAVKRDLRRSLNAFMAPHLSRVVAPWPPPPVAA